jgi:hypothetical protein
VNARAESWTSSEAPRTAQNPMVVPRKIGTTNAADTSRRRDLGMPLRLKPATVAKPSGKSAETCPSASSSASVDATTVLVRSSGRR